MLGRSVLHRTSSYKALDLLVNHCHRGFAASSILCKQTQDVISKVGGVAKKTPRVQGQNPLRKVAIEAERTRFVKQSLYNGQAARQGPPKKVIAYCAAEQYDMHTASVALQSEGLILDPLRTGLYPQVLHARLPAISRDDDQISVNAGPHVQADVLVFPSGTVVTWNVAGTIAVDIIERVLESAKLNAHGNYAEMEEEDLDFIEDSTRSRSEIVGETIIIGTSTASLTSESAALPSETADDLHHSSTATSQTNTVLAKIAFSSGMARSTKLAMLERLTEDYITSTRSIPLNLAKGSWPSGRPAIWQKFCNMLGLTPRLPFSRPFILRKTGELLAIRAQLNLYSELTDSLPDLFWDSKHELRLENYYDMIARTLDVGVRIKILNEKMDYAQEIATVLRETLSERHSLRLEWGIIVLIAIEVIFECDQRWRKAG